MFGSPIISIFITLSFTYFLLSVIVSSFKEIISTLLKMRSKMLERALKNFLKGDEWKKLWGKMADSPFVSSSESVMSNSMTGLSSWLKLKQFPSYLSASNFSQALFSVLRNNRVKGDTGPLTVEHIRHILDQAKEAIDKVTAAGGDLDKAGLDPKTKELVTTLGSGTIDLLNNLLDKAGDKMSTLEKLLGKTFDESMSHLTDLYKRKTQIVLFALSLGIVGILNVDTINIARHLWKNPEQNERAADMVVQMLANVNKDTLGNFNIGVQDDSVVTRYVVRTQKFLNAGPRTGDDSVQTAIDTLITDVQRQAVRVGQAHNALQKVGIPMGWMKLDPQGQVVKENGKAIWDCPVDFEGWLLKILGLLMTAAAITLGAPFWFDLVTKFVNIRGGGKPPVTLVEAEAQKAKSVKKTNVNLSTTNEGGDAGAEEDARDGDENAPPG